MRNTLMIAAAAVAAALVSATAPARAAVAAPERVSSPEASGPLAGWAREGSDRAAAIGNDIKDGAEKAILLGGAFLYTHRHAVAGGVLGCAAGAAVGASSAGAAALATGGAALAAAPPLSALGCATGAAAGISLGRELDAP
jgi:hypothetical protein